MFRRVQNTCCGGPPPPLPDGGGGGGGISCKGGAGGGPLADCGLVLAEFLQAGRTHRNTSPRFGTLARNARYTYVDPCCCVI